MSQFKLENINKLVLHFFVLLLFSSSAFGAENIKGKVISIADGDTLTLLVDRKQIKVRLAEIDTPESGQPYGNKAKQELSKLVFGKHVVTEIIDVDRYGRAIGRVYFDGKYINEELIRIGAAWVYRKYVQDKSLFEVENQAREKRVGLWGLSETQRIPPWEWRHGGHKNQQIEASGEADSVCNGKRYCGQMTGCAEAKMYLKQCGVSSLDGDKDGVPCESLCRQ
jgi:endonuclease YncB( thermonuclease family)